MTKGEPSVKNERKALRSLFSFLHQEGLYPDDPIKRIKHIRVASPTASGIIIGGRS